MTEELHMESVSSNETRKMSLAALLMQDSRNLVNKIYCLF